MSVYFLVGLYAFGTAIYRLLAICCPEQPTSDKRINQSINQSILLTKGSSTTTDAIENKNTNKNANANKSRMMTME